jgi:phosphoribosylformimino-5-aminoimidazole carboxamide ribotide isomerase
VNIVPVIDLMDGQVVHAKHGNRKNYQPIRSLLCNSSTPEDIVSTLLRLYPFRQLYIADINAIQGNGHHLSTIKHILAQYPQIEIWLDAGINQADMALDWLAAGVLPVIGSESLASLADYHVIQHKLADAHVLSLDWLDDKFLGPTTLVEDTQCWPQYVIAMTLNRVGSGAGPDIARLKQLQTKHRNIYCAGGVRNFDDLKTLANMEITGALVASALHDGSLSDKEIGLFA